MALKCLDILKKSGKSKSIIKRVFNFMRNPKLAHILVTFTKLLTCTFYFKVSNIG